MATEPRPTEGLASPTTNEELQVAIAGNLHELYGLLPYIEALKLARQSLISFTTPAVRELQAKQARHERELDVLDFEVRPGLQQMRPEARLVGVGATETPVATLDALSVSEEITWMLHDVVRRIVADLAERGVCSIIRLPDEPSLEQLRAHVRELVWDVTSSELLKRIHSTVAWLVWAADKVVYGDGQTPIDDPCPFCGRRTLMAYMREDLIVCGRDPRSHHNEPCRCPDTTCECRQRPVSHRHSWIRTPPSAPNSWRRLNELLGLQRRAASKEKKR